MTPEAKIRTQVDFAVNGIRSIIWALERVAENTDLRDQERDAWDAIDALGEALRRMERHGVEP